MAELKISHTRLENGLWVAQIHLPGFHSVTNFLAIRSGSRYENARNNGIAHFLEHMVFKGTKKYPDSKSVAQAIEGVGGYFNAWTAQDHTAYWNVVPSQHYALGVEMPFELAFRPLVRAEDLERERGVIIEEIRMIQDNPASYVHDLSTELLFAGHPLGQPIIGTEENIRSMDVEEFRSYLERFYAPSQALFIAVGDVEDKGVEALVTSQTAQLTARTVTALEEFTGSSERSLRLLSKKTDQTHFVLAVADPSLALTKRERFTGVVLNAVLGRGMSSRLFLNIREKRGLAYAISSHLHILEDTGSLAIYGGVNTAKVEQALSAVQEELSLLQTELVSRDELQRAKNLVNGTYDLKSDDPVSLARWYGASFLLGMRETFAEAKLAIEAVTAEEVRKLAKRIFDKQRQTLAVIGPYESDVIFARFLNTQ